MTASQARRVLPIYRKNLTKYTGDKAAIQRRLIARLEQDAKGQKK